MEKPESSCMCPLNLPPYEAQMRVIDGHLSILDVLRRRYVALTPEEWVRQHFIHYLIRYKGYPSALMANETQLSLGSKRLRCDSVLYDKELRPRMIIEYKAPAIAITQKVFEQISVYNLLLHVDYLTVSNGMSHYCCRIDYATGGYTFLDDIPAYADL